MSPPSLKEGAPPHEERRSLDLEEEVPQEKRIPPLDKTRCIHSVKRVLLLIKRSQIGRTSPFPLSIP